MCATARWPTRYCAARSSRPTITGVAFFDILHGQRGVAPNGIELHPAAELPLNQSLHQPVAAVQTRLLAVKREIVRARKRKIRLAFYGLARAELLVVLPDEVHELVAVDEAQVLTGAFEMLR